MSIKTLVYIILAWNLFVFFMFGLDKQKAKAGKRRISEKTLILSAFLLGSIGGLLGMSLFRHKTKHLKFKLLMPLALIVNLGSIYLFAHKLL